MSIASKVSMASSQLESKSASVNPPGASPLASGGGCSSLKIAVSVRVLQTKPWVPNRKSPPPSTFQSGPSETGFAQVSHPAKPQVTYFTCGGAPSSLITCFWTTLLSRNCAQRIIFWLCGGRWDARTVHQ